MSTISSLNTPPCDDLPTAHDSTMSAWERLKDAQTALMQREANEACLRRARRISSRESIVIHSPIRGPTLSEFSADCTTTPPHRLQTAPSSILRRSTSSTSSYVSPPSSSPSLSSLDSYTALPKRVSRSSSSTSFTPSDFGPVLWSTKTSEIKGLRRRSSRVRFSDESDARENAEDGLAVPASSIEAKSKRLSAIDGLREDIAHSSRILRLDTTTLSILTGTMRSDPVDLTFSPKAKLSVLEADDGFAPQPLPYPKMSRKLSRLSSSNLYAAAQLDVRGPPTSSVSPPTSPIREIYSRLSVSSSPGRSIVISHAPMVRASNRYIASTLASAAEVDRTVSAGASDKYGAEQSAEDTATPLVLESNTHVEREIPWRAFALDNTGPSSTTHRRESSGASSSSIKKHHRSASIFDDVLNFPLPPSRHFTEEVTTTMPESETTLEEGQQAEDSGSGSSEICLDTPRPCSGVSTFSSPPNVTDSPPPSPTLAEMLFVGRSKSQWDSDAEKIVSSPLLDAAVSSGILSPNSRLLKPASPLLSRSMPRRSLSSSSQALRSGLSFTRGKGWSGSESEEEEFGKAIKSIISRRNSSRPQALRSASTNSPTIDSRQHESRSRPKSSSRTKSDRLSQLSVTSSAPSSADSVGPLTPHEVSVSMAAKAILPPVKLTRPPHARRSSSHSSSSSSTIPGDFPWGGSAPPSPGGSVLNKSGYLSPNRKTFYEDLNQSLQSVAQEGQKEKRKKMPRPTRKVEGWGKPEILLEEAWKDNLQRQTLWNSSDEEMEWSKSQPSSKSGTPKGSTRRGFSPDSPNLSALGFGKTSLGEEGWGSLFDEQMPAIGLAI